MEFSNHKLDHIVPYYRRINEQRTNGSGNKKTICRIYVKMHESELSERIANQ